MYSEDFDCVESSPERQAADYDYDGDQSSSSSNSPSKPTNQMVTDTPMTDLDANKNDHSSRLSLFKTIPKSITCLMSNEGVH